MVDRSRLGRLSRRKGKTWERQIVNMLKPIFGATVKRGLAQSRFGAAEEPDVKNVPRLWVEAKHGKQVNLRAALEQAEQALAASQDGKPRDRWPVAFCKDDHERPVAVLRLDDFLALLEEWWRWQGSVHVTDESQPGVHVPPVSTAAEGLEGSRNPALREG